jgi:hypothetical protein
VLRGGGGGDQTCVPTVGYQVRGWGIPTTEVVNNGFRSTLHIVGFDFVD